MSPLHITDTPENAPSVSTIPLALEISPYKMGLFMTAQRPLSAKYIDDMGDIHDQCLVCET